MKRMNMSSSSINPLLDTESGKSSNNVNSNVPSNAFMESAKVARASLDWVAPSANDRSMRRGKIGIKTMILVYFLIIGGLICFITGLIFYLAPSANEKQVNVGGLDLLIVGVIMLIPGLWGAVNWVGTYRGWYGFSYQAFSLD